MSNFQTEPSNPKRRFEFFNTQEEFDHLKWLFEQQSPENGWLLERIEVSPGIGCFGTAFYVQCIPVDLTS